MEYHLIKTKISELFDKSTTSLIYKNSWISLGELTNANIEKVKKNTGIDLTGYKRIIDNYSIRHIIHTHGDPIKENKRGQIAIVKDDIMMIPEIINTSDDISYAGTTKQGREAILYKKRLNGFIYYIEEIRTGRKKVVPVTMYKKKVTAPDAS